MTSRAIGLVLEIYDGPGDPCAVGDAILAFYNAMNCAPQRITSIRPRGTTRVFKRKIFESLVADPTVTGIFLTAQNQDLPEVWSFLRFVPDPKAPGTEEFQQRLFSVTMPAPASSALHGPLLDLLHRVVPHVALVHGSVALYRSMWAASHECQWGTSPPDVDEPTRLRLKEDALSWSTKRRRLRRLYPVTIIGPELWAQLPPMPSVEPKPRIEDLGTGKMLTVWPELCGPRDPEFLRGTRALREWLWPHTIQNPADHVDQDPPGIIGSGR